MRAATLYTIYRSIFLYYFNHKMVSNGQNQYTDYCCYSRTSVENIIYSVVI